MSEIVFKTAVRENVGLLISLAGGTGSGKTMSAMRLARGICGDKKFCVIDTEAKRALHYADSFAFDHYDFKPPFRPASYTEAIIAADKAGYGAIVVDSGSHVWAGDGGLLDWWEEEIDRMAGDDWKKREACKMAGWIAPKSAHKKMVQRLLQIRSTLILCLRAEEKIEMKRDENGKMRIEKKTGVTGLDGWFPICEKNLPYEMTASFLLLATRPGYPLAIKLQEQHKALFPLDQPIDENSGRRIAEWAAGGKVITAAVTQPAQNPATKSGPNPELVALKRKLWEVCVPKHGGKAGVKPTQEQIAAFENFLMEDCGMSDTEDAAAMTVDRLRELITKAEEQLKK